VTITVEDLACPDKTLARHVLIHARVIAPCLQSLDGEDAVDAIAILDGVAREAKRRGDRRLVSQSVGTARATYVSSTEAASWFTEDDRQALRSLCAVASLSSQGHPVGRFPAPSTAIRRVWPEEET
jgi:hypothetical protein